MSENWYSYKSEYSDYNNDILFKDGILSMDLCDINRDCGIEIDLSQEETRKLYEAMKEYYNG